MAASQKTREVASQVVRMVEIIEMTKDKRQKTIDNRQQTTDRESSHLRVDFRAFFLLVSRMGVGGFAVKIVSSSNILCPNLCYPKLIQELHILSFSSGHCDAIY